MALAHNLTQRWHDSVAHALKAFGRGRAAFELWYEWDSVRKLHLLGGLEYLEFADSSLRLDEASHIAGVDLKVGDKRHRLPANNCWWFALDATPSCPHGKSRYLGAPHRIWKARRALERNYDAWLDKFALGHGVLKAPSQYPPLWKNSQSGYADSNLDGTPADPLEDGERLLAELRSGGVAVLPSETDEHGAPLWSYEPPSIRQDAGPLEWGEALLDGYRPPFGRHSRARRHARRLYRQLCDGLTANEPGESRKDLEREKSRPDVDPPPKTTIASNNRTAF